MWYTGVYLEGGKSQKYSHFPHGDFKEVSEIQMPSPKHCNERYHVVWKVVADAHHKPECLCDADSSPCDKPYEWWCGDFEQRCRTDHWDTGVNTEIAYRWVIPQGEASACKQVVLTGGMSTTETAEDKLSR